MGFLPGADTALVSFNPVTGLEGKFSIEYVMTALLLDGKVTLESFTDPMVMRPEVRAFMPSIAAALAYAAELTRERVIALP